MKLKLSFWVRTLIVAYLFLGDIATEGYSVQAALVLTMFNPFRWAPLVVGAFMARRTTTRPGIWPPG